MEEWKIKLGSIATEANLVGGSGKEKRVSVKCNDSSIGDVHNIVLNHLNPLYNGSIKSTTSKKSRAIFNTTTVAAAVELCDCINNAIAEYNAYINGTSGTPANGNPTKDDPETPTPDNPDPDEDKDYSSVVKLIIIAGLLYLLLSYIIKD